MIIDADKSRHPTVTDTGIYGFFDEFRWLSNFHLCKIEVDGIVYPSTENAYQAMKLHTVAHRMKFAECTPYQSKKLSYAFPIEVDDWDTVKVGVMMLLQIKKYAIPELREKLLMTDGYYLEETNNWSDNFWGVDGGVGKNMLGHCIMMTRSHYKSL